jgi:hypothetical protein
MVLLLTFSSKIFCVEGQECKTFALLPPTHLLIFLPFFFIAVLFVQTEMKQKKNQSSKRNFRRKKGKTNQGIEKGKFNRKERVKKKTRKVNSISLLKNHTNPFKIYILKIIHYLA